MGLKLLRDKRVGSAQSAWRTQTGGLIHPYLVVSWLILSAAAFLLTPSPVRLPTHYRPFSVLGWGYTLVVAKEGQEWRGWGPEEHRKGGWGRKAGGPALGTSFPPCLPSDLPTPSSAPVHSFHASRLLSSLSRYLARPAKEISRSLGG